MAVSLKIVSDNPLPAPPYAEDTKVRGWKFNLDHERINQSDTWALAPADMRPWLLMLWHVAWQQIPAGSFSNDDAVISAKIGMDARMFAANRDILLRGWKQCSDGRLYHPVITEQVLNYQEHNRKERKRVAEWRAKKDAEKQAESYNDVTCNKRVSTTPEPEPEPEPSSYLLTPDGVNCETRKRDFTGSPVPFEKIKALWAEVCPHLPQPVKLSPARKAIIRARWHDELPDLDSWRECFGHIAASNFLSGRVTPRPGQKPFRCTLEWICKQENLLKLYEGKYDNA